ncbi:sigma factor-like helix-turn-helix DNA-binding protein [Archangium minus]|uniref:sigma factor-like helix-turn-helix DNA-binding protein n=1 Tax=Archangium minus TaxID=83450 RepID=UPI0037C04AF3
MSHSASASLASLFVPHLRPAAQAYAELPSLETVLTQVLAEALAALPSRERTVLRLHLVEGLSLERIGTVYRTHKSTVSRWLARAREEVLAGTRSRLASPTCPTVRQVVEERARRVSCSGFIRAP